MRVDFGGVVVRGDTGGPFGATVRGRVRGANKALGNTVVVGDRVHLAWDAERAVIEDVEPRRNAFSRRASGERPEEQVVAANLDVVLLVASLRRPDFKHGFVDRVLAQADVAGIPARLVLNKADLASEPEIAGVREDYALASVETFTVCAANGEGIAPLREVCRGLRSLCIGHSGVGKSTLLSVLAPGFEPAQGEVNEKTGKGRHTTTAAVLIESEPGLELIDTPGVRSFGLWGVQADDLVWHYPELAPHVGHCRFGDCRHGVEPGCALRAALARGEVTARRFESFVKLREELR